MFEQMVGPAITFGLALVAFVVLLYVLKVFARMYTRASKELSFVRTGLGGQKVILNGGALVLPVIHEVIPVNMNTLKLDVHRAAEQALITRDRMRVDVTAEFFVRVQPTEESIANAAQTLGRKTIEPELLKELVEGKFVDALRSVAAEMGMEELHEQRTLFVQKVQQAVSEDLLKNGLELEAVSLTGLDQTSKEYFNPDNTFDAEGLTKLTESIELRRKKRNEIQVDTEMEIQKKNLIGAQQKLMLVREEEYAKIEQEREIGIRRASQQAEIATQQAEKTREAEQGKIAAQLQIDQSRLNADRAMQDQRIAMDQQLKEREIVKARSVQTAEIEQLKAVQMAEQDRAIAIAEKSRAQSEAQALADEARANAVRAAEQVDTVREVERAERQKKIELVEASRQAEREMIGVTIAAEAEKKAANDKADAIRTLATAEADQKRIAAQAAADAEKMGAEAAEKRYAVDADGQRRLNEAANMLSAEQIALQIKLAVLRHLPDIIRESVKPIAAIDGIKIVQVEGLNSGGGAHTHGENGQVNATAGSGNLADQVVSSALRYRAQAPLIESLMKEVGITGGDLNGMTASLHAEDNHAAQVRELIAKRDALLRKDAS